MSVYDIPSRKLVTGKFSGAGPNTPCKWALVKGKVKGTGSSVGVNLETFIRIDIGNLNQLTSTEGEPEYIAATIE